MPQVLLDTHVLLWWRTDPKRLSSAQRETLSEAERRGQPLLISAVSLRELAKMGARGLIELAVPWELWLEELELSPLVKVLPLTARIAAESVRLGRDFPKDPFDQIIAATARCHALHLMTVDQDIRRWGKVPMI
jgi:PIN domain nuclease of toxin-antitoxin system